MALSKDATRQIQLAWDETIGPYINSVSDGVTDFLEDITAEDLKQTLYDNVTQCHFDVGMVRIGGNSNRHIRFQTKEALMAEINKMWDQDYQGDVSIIKPYLKA